MFDEPILESIRPSELSDIFKSKGGISGYSSWSSAIPIIILIITIIILLIYLGTKFLKQLKLKRRKKKDHERFMKLCEDRNLTYHQIKILEKLAEKYDKLPSALLLNKKEFNYITLKENKYLLSKYKKNNPIYADFDSNMRHIKAVFLNRKPAGGESLHSTRDIHVGTSLIFYIKIK